MILWKCLHFCEENAASQQNVGTVGLSYFSDIRVKPAAPGPKTPGGDPETGAAQRRGKADRFAAARVKSVSIHQEQR